MNKRISLLIVLLFLFVSKTNAQQLPLPDEPFRFHKDHTENGLIFGTISFTNIKADFDSYIPFLECLSEDKKEAKRNSGHFIISHDNVFSMKHVGELDGGKTYLFVLQRNPGNYAVTNIRCVKTTAMGYGSNQNTLGGFSVPFDVKKGEITYIGNIIINEDALPGEMKTSIADKFDRDKNALKNMYKFVNWDSATKSSIEMIPVMGK